MQPLQICIGPTSRIGRESWCLPYAGFFLADCTLTIILYKVQIIFLLDSNCNSAQSGRHILS